MNDDLLIEVSPGNIIAFPKDTAPEEIERISREIFKGDDVQVEASGFPGAGVIEPAMTMASGAASTVAGGLIGGNAIYAGDPEKGAEVAQSIAEGGTYLPRTQKGREGLESVSKAVEFTAKLFGLENAGQRLGGFVLDNTNSPAAAAMTEGAIAVVPDIVGFKGANSARRFAGKDIDPGAKEIIQAGERAGVPVLHTDVRPPQNFLGKMMQQFSEKLGPFGSGVAREGQQITRKNAVEELAREFDVSIDSEAAEGLVSSLKRESARKLAVASEMRGSAVDALIPYGNVPMNNALRAIDLELRKQARLGEKADTSLISNLEKTKSALQQGEMDFSVAKDIRTELIDDGLALSRSEDRRAMGAISRVKQGMDADMRSFAADKDRGAAAKWLRSNRDFADIFADIRETELKRILKTGEATPEKVLTILSGGKRSELTRLYSNLDERGRASARGAIVQSLMERSGYFGSGPNPSRLATEMNRPKALIATDVFFQGDDRRVLIGLRKLLDATRRAQDASAAPPTGVQTLPLLAGGGVGYGFALDPVTTAGLMGSVTAVAKAYESKPFRNLMLKIASTSRSRPVKPALLEAGSLALIEALRASTAESSKEKAG